MFKPKHSIVRQSEFHYEQSNIKEPNALHKLPPLAELKSKVMPFLLRSPALWPASIPLGLGGCPDGPSTPAPRPPGLGTLGGGATKK